MMQPRVGRGDEAFEQRMRLVRLIHMANSTSQRRSASNAGDRFLGGNIASISSFHRTASSKVFRDRFGSIPLQSGNCRAGASRSALSLVGTGAS